MADYIERKAAIKAAQNDAEYDSVEEARHLESPPLTFGLWCIAKIVSGITLILMSIVLAMSIMRLTAYRK